MYEFKDVTVGADPEVFFIKKDGTPQSVEGLIGGSKSEPLPIKELPAGYFIQEDNVAAEFNIPPAKTPQAFSKNIAMALKYVNELAKKNSFTVEVASAMHFPKEQLQTPHAQHLGCDPDMNGWTGTLNPRPVPPETLRTAAGHVHVGWVTPQTRERQALAQSLDLFLGVPSILATRRNERRSLYGKACAVRIKDYGIEYRTLDNFWIQNAANSQFVFTQVQKAIEFIRSNQHNIHELLENHEEMIVEAINDHNLELAARICGRFNTGLFPVAYVK